MLALSDRLSFRIRRLSLTRSSELKEEDKMVKSSDKTVLDCDLSTIQMVAFTESLGKAWHLFLDLDSRQDLTVWLKLYPLMPSVQYASHL